MSAILAMLRRSAVLIHELGNIFKAGDRRSTSRGVRAAVFGVDPDAPLGQQFRVAELNPWRTAPHVARGQRRLRPFVAPRRPVN